MASPHKRAVPQRTPPWIASFPSHILIPHLGLELRAPQSSLRNPSSLASRVAFNMHTLDLCCLPINLGASDECIRRETGMQSTGAG